MSVNSFGPIKELINELSKYCLVSLVDEYNTSQICHSCKEEKVEYLKTIEQPKERVIKKILDEKKSIKNIRKKELLTLKKEVKYSKYNSLRQEEKRIKLEEEKRSLEVKSHKLCCCKSDDQKLCNEALNLKSIKHKIEVKEEKNKLKSETHKLCKCKNEKHGNKLWSRNYNSAKSIEHVMKQKMLGRSVGKYTRKKSEAEGII